MTDVEKRELDRYFSPIYYAEIVESKEGELFPNVHRWGFYPTYREGENQKQALQYFSERKNVKRIIEKSMKTGREKVIREREVLV